MSFILGETTVIADTIQQESGTGISINGINATISPSSMQINPFLDWSPVTLAHGTIGIPMWIFITAGIILIFLYVLLSWIFKLKRMAGVKGYVQAADKGTQEDLQVWIFGKTKKLTIECLKYWGGLIHYPEGVKITKWKHPSVLSTMSIGGQTAVAVSDEYDHSRDFVSEIALIIGGEYFNTHLNEMQSKFGPNVKPILSFKDYRDFGRYYLTRIFPSGIPIPSYCIFDHTLFRKYFPKGRDGDLKGGVFIRKSRKLKDPRREPSLFEKLAPIGATVIFVSIVIFAAMYCPLGK